MNSVLSVICWLYYIILNNLKMNMIWDLLLIWCFLLWLPIYRSICYENHSFSQNIFLKRKLWGINSLTLKDHLIGSRSFFEIWGFEFEINSHSEKKVLRMESKMRNFQQKFAWIENNEDFFFEIKEFLDMKFFLREIRK